MDNNNKIKDQNEEPHIPYVVPPPPPLTREDRREDKNIDSFVRIANALEKASELFERSLPVSVSVDDIPIPENICVCGTDNYSDGQCNCGEQ